MTSGIKIAAALCILLVEIFCVRGAKAVDIYSNPVLVEIFRIRSPKAQKTSPHHVSETIGIGDPAVIFYEGKYYLYPTGDNHSYDVYISSDLIHWTKGPKVFRSAEPGVWAPDVFYHAEDGKFYLFYTVNGRIGAATADRPDGIFADRGTLIKNAIDAHLFLDEDGKYYLYYVKVPAFRIYVQPMETPLKKKGEPVQIIQPTESWEKKKVPVTEAPWMLRHQGLYYLLYSGGSADTSDYAIGYATAKSPVGPFAKYRGNPIVKRAPGVFGPGHCSVTRDSDDKLWMVYHQKTDDTRGWDRIICIDPIWFDEKGVLHGKATRAIPQPAPDTNAGKRYPR